MKPFVKQVINEARVQRTIDSKIWATMSSASSKNRANGAVDVKPRKSDDKNILLLKYVAGLLTIKARCPKTIEDIDLIGSYKLIGQAAVNAGVTLSEIQKLYVENGGEFDGTIGSDTLDYPSYDEADDNSTEETDSLTSFDNDIAAKINNEPDDDLINDPDDDLNNVINTEEKTDYPSYDEVDDDPTKFGEKVADLSRYFKTVGNSLKFAHVGDYLIWDESEGLTISSDITNAIAKCVIAGNSCIDKKPRFMFIHTTNATLGNAGNNDVYDSYYFTKNNPVGRKRLSVNPGSKYYYQEEINGVYYTSILADNDNNAANAVKELVKIDNIQGVTNAQSFEIIKQLRSKTYLPTLPELTKAINNLDSGNYWTSSVADNGNANIMLGVNPDKLYKITNTDANGIVTAFITI